MKCSTGLKWVKELNMFKINVTILLFILKSILLMGPNHNQITAMMILFTYLQEKSISITSGNKEARVTVVIYSQYNSLVILI